MLLIRKIFAWRVVLALIFFFVSFPAVCQERALVEHDGKRGYWFELEIGDRILADLEKYVLLKEKTAELELKISLKEISLNLKIEENEALEQIGNHWKEAFEEEQALHEKDVEVLQDRLEAKDSWWNSNVLWLGVGFLLGAGLIVLLVYALGPA